MNAKAIAKIICALAFSGSGLSLAQTEAPHTFESGQTARAAEVNENFSVLEQGINSNEAEIAANSGAILDNTVALGNLPDSQVQVLEFDPASDCTVDAPGNYAVNRNWLVMCAAANAPDSPCGGIRARILISADDVFLDLNGYALEIEDCQSVECSTVISVTGSNVTIKNGSLISDGFGICAEDADGTVVKSVSGSSTEVGTNGRVFDSKIGGSFENCSLAVGSGSIVSRNTIGDSFGAPSLCVWDGNSVIQSNVLLADPNDVNFMNSGVPHLFLAGSDSVVEGNIVEGPLRIGNFGDAAENILRGNILRGNVIRGGLRINTDGNFVDNNYVFGGVTFTSGSSGNYLGDNRISGTGPFVVPPEQVDWGSNVSF